MMKKLAMTIIMILLPSVCLADFSIRFENTFDRKMVYMLYWIDNPFELDEPFNMAGGELGARQSREIPPLKAGDYFVVWQGRDHKISNVKMKIEKTVASVAVTPEKVIVLDERPSGQ